MANVINTGFNISASSEKLLGWEDIPSLPITELTDKQINGEGVFDVLMETHYNQLDRLFKTNRITAKDMATVYTESLQTVLAGSIEFLLQSRKSLFEANLLMKQTELVEAQIEQQKKNNEKIPHEIELIKAQVDLTRQQHNLAVLEETTVRKNWCKLDGEFDSIVANTSRIKEETKLIAQKIITELAQVSGAVTEPNSVIGRQKELYEAQIKGFDRDSKIKYAKVFTDAFSVMRSTDDAISGNSVNQLDDVNIGSAVSVMRDSMS